MEEAERLEFTKTERRPLYATVVTCTRIVCGIPLSGGVPVKKLYKLTSATKLVGLSSDDSDQLLVIGKDLQQHDPLVALLSIGSGKVTVIPHNPQSNEDRIMLGHLAGWERVYGDTRLYTERNEKGSRRDDDRLHRCVLEAGERCPDQPYKLESCIEQPAFAFARWAESGVHSAGAVRAWNDRQLVGSGTAA